MNANKPLRRKMAYVEFLSCAEEIESLLAQGFSKKMIHERLKGEGHISMAYVTFCQTMQKIAGRGLHKPRQDKPDKPAHSPVKPPAVQPPPGSGPRRVDTAHEPFPDPRKMSLEDGI